MIGEQKNYDNVFFRDLTLSILDTLESELYWINNFSSNKTTVNVPFYHAMTGDERFLLDAFTDDIIGNRFTEMNTDIIPRGHLDLTGVDIRSDEMANPNVFIRINTEIDEEMRKVLVKIRAIPLTVKYDMTIILSTNIDYYKCMQAIMDKLWLYRFMNFEYNGIPIDAILMLPGTNQFTKSKETNLTTSNVITLSISIDVQTYYPAYTKPGLYSLSDIKSAAYDYDNTQQPNTDDFIYAKRSIWYDYIMLAKSGKK